MLNEPLKLLWWSILLVISLALAHELVVTRVLGHFIELMKRGLEAWFELYFEAKKKGKEGAVGTNPKA